MRSWSSICECAPEFPIAPLPAGGYIGDSTRAEIRFARELGRPIRYTDPLGYAVILTRPNLDAIRLGPYEYEHQAEGMAAGLRRQTYNTQHVEGTTIAVGAYRPELGHLAPRVDGDPYALADAMDDDPGGDGTGRNFPDLYARLAAQEGNDRAAELWGKACHVYDYLRHGPARTATSRSSGEWSSTRITGCGDRPPAGRIG